MREQVTKEDFKSFIKGYDIKLEPHVVTICEPLIMEFYDGDKVIAWKRLNEDAVLSEGQLLLENEYYIER